MNKTLILIVAIYLVILSFVFPSFADEIFAVEKPDGSLAIHYYLGGGKSLEKTLEQVGFSGYPIHRITERDLPASRADRKYWKWSNGRIEIDTVKKAVDIQKENEKIQKKEAVLTKLKIDDEELKSLKYALDKI